jgi:hypothetical protein
MLSACAIICRWLYKLPFRSETVWALLYLFCLNLIECILVTFDKTRSPFVLEWAFYILLSIPFIVTRFYQGWLFYWIEIILIIFIPRFTNGNLQIISIFIYCFILPIWLSMFVDKLNVDNQMANQQNAHNTNLLICGNILTYLSLVLPGTYFYGGWFWHAETAFGENIFNSNVEKEVTTKLLTVFVILIMFTILALKRIAIYLFSIQITCWCMYILESTILFVAFFMFICAKAFTVPVILIVFTILALVTIGLYLFYIGKANCCMYLLKTMILFVAFFIFTLVLSTIIIIAVHIRNPLSIDQHEWIITNSGLSVSDQDVIDKIQWFDFNMTFYDRAEEELVPLIRKYELKYQQNHRWPAKKSNECLGKLYLLYGKLQYHQNKFENAYTYLCKSLERNHSSMQANIYIMNTLVSLNQRHELHLYILNLIKKSEDPKMNALILEYLPQELSTSSELRLSKLELLRLQSNISLLFLKMNALIREYLPLPQQLPILTELRRLNLKSLPLPSDIPSLPLNMNALIQEDLPQESSPLSELGLSKTELVQLPSNISSSSVKLATLLNYMEHIENDAERLEEDQKRIDIENSRTPTFFAKLWPTHRQLAELSTIAYSRKDLSFPTWTTLKICDDTLKTGYYGIAFQHSETNETVIAHRGTDNIASVVADYDLYSLTLPKQLYVARNFTDEIRRTYIPKQKQILWHTGHSLGGAIAEFLVANETLFVEDTLNSLSFAVTFDSPGIMELLEVYYCEELKHLKKKSTRFFPPSTDFRVISYLSTPNIVNTMGTHIGLVLQVSQLPLVFKEWHPLIKTFYTLMNRKWFHEYETAINFTVTLLIDQYHSHSLPLIIQCFELRPFASGISWITGAVIEWPKGVQELVRFRRFYDSDTYYKITDCLSGKYTHHRVVVLGDHRTSQLPKELLPIRIERFLNQTLTVGIPQSVVTQLNTNCTVFKLIGANSRKFIFDKILKPRDSILMWNPNKTMLILNHDAGPVIGDTEYKINILTLYTLFSLANSDECILTEPNDEVS